MHNESHLIHKMQTVLEVIIYRHAKLDPVESSAKDQSNRKTGNILLIDYY